MANRQQDMWNSHSKNPKESKNRKAQTADGKGNSHLTTTGKVEQKLEEIRLMKELYGN